MASVAARKTAKNRARTSLNGWETRKLTKTRDWSTLESRSEDFVRFYKEG